MGRVKEGRTQGRCLLEDRKSLTQTVGLTVVNHGRYGKRTGPKRRGGSGTLRGRVVGRLD